jgi:hypothetical protein
MKAFGGFGLLLFLAVTVYWLSISAGGGQKEVAQFQIAYGKPGANGIEMHIVIGVVTANLDRTSKDGRLLSWEEWIATHFELKDAGGNTLVLERRNNSNAIQQNQVIGTQEFFLVAALKPGQDYTLEYIPELKNPGRYRCAFTAPSSAEKVRMVDLRKVK